MLKDFFIKYRNVWWTVPCKKYEYVYDLYFLEKALFKDKYELLHTLLSSFYLPTKQVKCVCIQERPKKQYIYDKGVFQPMEKKNTLKKTQDIWA